jgi:hypothetical protein
VAADAIKAKGNISFACIAHNKRISPVGSREQVWQGRGRWNVRREDGRMEERHWSSLNAEVVAVDPVQ